MFDPEAFLHGYLECAAWCGAYDDSPNGESVEVEIDELPDEFTAEAEEACADFCEAMASDLERYARGFSSASAGHDFYLTRNRHGAGFWDRGLGALGERARACAHPCRQD